VYYIYYIYHIYYIYYIYSYDFFDPARCCLSNDLCIAVIFTTLATDHVTLEHVILEHVTLESALDTTLIAGIHRSYRV
jgi:hypothetical protein